jgi:hypothetical protein
VCLHHHLLSASGKPPPSRLASVSATPLVLSHLTCFQSSCAGPRALLELRSAPQAVGPPCSLLKNCRVVAALVSVRLDVIPLPRPISRANTLPRRRPWMRHVDTFQLTSQPSPGSARAASRTLSLAATPGQSPRAPCGQRRGSSTRCVMGHARPGRAHRSGAAQATRTVRVGRPRGFHLVDGVLNKNYFLFILNSIQIQTLKIHISLLIAPKIMKSVPLDS